MRADARRRREAIIEAAKTVFAAGPDSGTLEDVAKVAGVGIATVYRNFRDKDALLIALLDDLLAAIVTLQEDTLASFESLPERKWHAYAHGLIDLGLAPLIVKASDDTVRELLPHFLEFRDQITANNRRIVGLARQHGLVRADISSALFINGIIQAARPAVTTILPAVPNVETQLVDIVLTGLRPAP
ncbi:TetR/AcrR family transcriptional regulator [Corynebacterium hindlerae]|uniref:TetR/AcrR family transcriptional regulator n=1 Tax=Corynebacterium hindlerae TaxID=699041 RepID=UPI003AAE69D0